jgi:sialic acid synthase SpsE/protoporphyrinogen oxidase
MEKMKKVYIIGAGPSGLITGWELAKKGISVVIFEKSGITGGMCRSWEDSGYILDTGPHIYHTPEEHLSNLWKIFFGDILIEGDFWSKNTVDGNINNLVDYPLSWESINNFSSEVREQIHRELQTKNQDKSIGATSFSEYVNNLVGPTLAKMFFTKYPQKLWGIPTTNLTAEWAPKRIEIREKITPFYISQYAAVGKFGTGCVYDRIRDEILKLGGEIKLNEGVSSIEIEANSCVAINTTKNKSYPITDEVIVSTMPITLLGKMMGIKTSLQFRGIATVHIGIKTTNLKWPEGIHWLYFDKSELFFNRVTNSTSLTPFVSPENYSLLSIESTYTKGDHFDMIPSNEIIETVIKQAETTGLFSPNSVEFKSINKEHFVYPLQFPGYQDDLSKLTAKVDSIHNLYSIGTGGNFNYADSQVIFNKAFDLVDIITNKYSTFTQTVKKKPRIEFKRNFKIKNVSVGIDNVPPIVIAEIGLNHNGNMDLAYKLIEEAVDCGIKFVKLQAYSSGNSRVSNKVKSANYVEKITEQEETLSQMFDKYNLDKKEQIKLFEYARSKDLIIFSTPFDIESADFLENELNPDCYKIASVDLVNLPLIAHVASFGKPMILSCGMSSLAEIEDALDTISSCENDEVILLHCISNYPAPIEEMNLNVIKTIQNTFKVPSGLSDHSLGLLASTISLANGACVIERHFTLNRLMEGPDHILSSEPDEMRELVYIAKSIKKIKGDGIKRIENGEYANINTQRKCLYVNKNLKTGDIIRPDDIVIKGPAGGILPKFLELVIGKSLRESIEEDFPLTWEKLLK